MGAFSIARGERENINDAVNELKHNPNLNLLIESKENMWLSGDQKSDAIKSYLIKIGVDFG